MWRLGLTAEPGRESLLFTDHLIHTVKYSRITSKTVNIFYTIEQLTENSILSQTYKIKQYFIVTQYSISWHA